MNGKDRDTARRSAGHATANGTDESKLDAALRDLYAHYGKGDVPTHLVELAERLEAARTAARQGKPGDRHAVADFRLMMSRTADGAAED